MVSIISVPSSTSRRPTRRLQMNPLPDNPISPDKHPAHNMHETCQSSCLTMPAHNELHGCSGASQSRNGASVRLSAIIHSFWKQSLSIQVSLGLQNEPDTRTHKARDVSDKVMYKKCLRTSRAAWAAVKF